MSERAIDESTAGSERGPNGPHDVDVAVVGGGPAGAAAALTLLRYTTHRVALVERSSYDDWRAGEALPPSVTPLLQYLDAASLLGDAHLPAHGTAAAWGGAQLVARDFLFIGRGTGWHLDRCAFDRALAQLVALRGGAVMVQTTVSGECFDGKRWRLAVQRGPSRLRAEVTARYVIDASGRRAAFARRRGARRTVDDRLFALVECCSFQTGAPRDTFTVVEAVPLGWWYSVVVPGRRMVVALMTDADIIRRERLQTLSSWRALLGSTVHTRPRLAGEQPEGPPIICPAFSQILDRIAGPGWIAAGDAAVSFDPLSSMGVGYAITSGIHAARAADAALSSNDALAAEYAASVRRHYMRYLGRKREYYGMERRWKDEPFWARRR